MSWGQSIGQRGDSGRRGDEINQELGVGPNGVATNHHQSGGGGCGICCTEQLAALQPSLEGCGAHNKILKNVMKQGL